MEWIKAVIATTSEGIELVFGLLLNCGVNGVNIIDDDEMIHFLDTHPLTWDYVDETLRHNHDENAYVVFYVSPGAEGQETLSQIKNQLQSLRQMPLDFSVGSLNIACETVDDAVWLNEWKKHYKPFRVGRTIVICPAWEDYKPQSDEKVFTIDPGAVFGTGLHQTTQLCIEAIEQYPKPGGHMLDIGCGSGILSIIAMLLGLKSVIACDFDPAAAIAARANVLRNPIDAAHYTILTGDIFADKTLQAAITPASYDLIAANIVADAIIGLAPMVSGLLKEKGIFIASGIITERIAEVTDTLSAHGFRLLETLERDGWYCTVAVCDIHA